MIERLLGHGLARALRASAEIDARVAEAMIAIPRHRFVRWRDLPRAYEDRSLTTGPGTSISQPTYVARVLSLARIERGDRVLEIGTGSGYTAAVLGLLAREVVTVERSPRLAAAARRRLGPFPNVRPVLGDGCQAAEGTFDAIVVMAGAPAIPPSCCARLGDAGRLIVPVGDRIDDGIRCRIVRVTRRGDALDEELLMPGDWNALVGRDGWPE